MLVVGLGGGSLPLFVHDYFSQARVAVVEIDPSMLDVATRWFGFSQGDRMQVHISDGLDYVAKLAAEGTNHLTEHFSCPIEPSGCHAGWVAKSWAVVTTCFLSLLCVTISSLTRSLQLTACPCQPV